MDSMVKRFLQETRVNIRRWGQHLSENRECSRSFFNAKSG